MLRAPLCLLLLLVGCTEPEPAGPAGSVAAAQVSYANAASGLASSNVQDALDEVVELEDDLEQRISSLETAEASPRVIVCRYVTASLTLDIGATFSHVYTAAECGGTLPDATYVGAIGAFESCTSRLNAVRVMNAGETNGPGVTLRKADENTAACTDAAELTSIYVKR
ncbi:MAG TPA: hypothetical protein VM513_18135 [Kofleriaceae bacterium]|nr:hypothetical protein [Kofleriaceae bacterium]